MDWEELIERTNEMIQVGHEEIVNNPFEVNALIDGWNLLVKDEYVPNQEQKRVYLALMTARRIFILNSDDELHEIKRYYLR